MRKRAMVLGLILVPLATGGAVLLAKSIHQSVPNKEATISLPASEATPSDHLSGEGSGFVLAPSEANDEPRDLKQQQSEEQQKREAPRQPNSPDEVDSDHAATEVLFASESSSTDVRGGVHPIASSSRDLRNSYAFANGRRSGATGGSGAGAQPVGSAPAADSKSPQGSSSPTDEPADTNTPHADSGTESSTHASSQPSANDTRPNDAEPNHNAGSDDAGSGSGTNDSSVNVPESGDSDADDSNPVDQPLEPSHPVPYFPPADDRPHVTVPEPSTLMLLGLGLLACAAASRRRRAKLK